jgi:hypothetical protein
MTLFKIIFGIDIASTEGERNMKEDKTFRRGQTRTPGRGDPLKSEEGHGRQDVKRVKR